MVIVDSPIKTIIIRKTQADDYSYYALILRHNVTGQTFLINLTNDSHDCRYFKFTVDFTNMPYGEYTYYIANNSPDWTIHINGDNIFRSCYTIDEDILLYATTAVINILEDGDLAVNAGDGDCHPLDFLQSCLLQYLSFPQYEVYKCCNYKVYEPKKGCN